jgi:hypothetical protein
MVISSIDPQSHRLARFNLADIILVNQRLDQQRGLGWGKVGNHFAGT